MFHCLFHCCISIFKGYYQSYANNVHCMFLICGSFRILSSDPPTEIVIVAGSKGQLFFYAHTGINCHDVFLVGEQRVDVEFLDFCGKAQQR